MQDELDRTMEQIRRDLNLIWISEISGEYRKLEVEESSICAACEQKMAATSDKFNNRSEKNTDKSNTKTFIVGGK